eukprot:jgi/Orpsp1_1/1176418/evm.model.c7180000057515.1
MLSSSVSYKEEHNNNTVTFGDYSNEEDNVQVDIKNNTSKEFLQLDEQQRIRLEKFLNSVEGYISKILLKNIKDESFKGYEVNWDENIIENVCKHILNNPIKYDNMTCTAVDWNYSGTIIASSYGSYSHENWCKHQGYINLWSLSQRNFDPNKPTYTLEVP